MTCQTSFNTNILSLDCYNFYIHYIYSLKSNQHLYHFDANIILSVIDFGFVFCVKLPTNTKRYISYYSLRLLSLYLVVCLFGIYSIGFN